MVIRQTVLLKRNNTICLFYPPVCHFYSPVCLFYPQVCLFYPPVCLFYPPVCLFDPPVFFYCCFQTSRVKNHDPVCWDYGFRQDPHAESSGRERHSRYLYIGTAVCNPKLIQYRNIKAFSTDSILTFNPTYLSEGSSLIISKLSQRCASVRFSISSHGFS